MEQELDRTTKILMALLLGTLSMFFAEVISGSSPLWFLDLFALLVTFPLYLAHTLFFLNLALHTNRYSLYHLYLWGVFYGLYESWITKVLFTGYPGSNGPILGQFFGIAIFEFSVLVFFFHNIFAFILPLLSFEILSRNWRSTREKHGKILKQFGKDIDNPRTLKISLGIIAVFAVNTLSNNTGYNILISIIAVTGTILIIWLLDNYINTRTATDSIITLESLKLDRKGMVFLSSYLALLYLTSFFVLNPQNLPDTVLTYVIILLIYLIIIYVLRRSYPVQPIQKVVNHHLVELVNHKRFYLGIFTYLTMVIIASLLPAISFVLFVTTQLLLAFLGPVFFVYAVKKTQE